MRAARRPGRYGQRNATLILLMYRHGLRVAEVIRLQWRAWRCWGLGRLCQLLDLQVRVPALEYGTQFTV
jgi:integrase